MSITDVADDCLIEGTRIHDAEIHKGDNLFVMESLLDSSVDLICTNPPFFIASQRPIPKGSTSSHQHLTQTWRTMTPPIYWKERINSEVPELSGLLLALREIHSIPLYNYLVYLSVRLIEMKRLLKETGSIFLHCGPDFSHPLKLCMDSIFGWKQFRNEIVYCFYGRGTNKRQRSFQGKHEILLFEPFAKFQLACHNGARNVKFHASVD